MSKLKAKLFLAAFVALNGFVFVPQAHADQDLNAARGPDGQIVVYCDSCWFVNCNCNG